MEIVSSVDGVGLEEHLLGALASRPRGGLLDPVLVLTPTGRLADHLKRRIAAKLGAALGIHLLHHRALAYSALESSLTVPPRALPRAALLGITEGLLDDPQGPWPAFLRERRGAQADLHDALEDLRLAGVSPAQLAGLPISPALAAIYPLYAAALERLAAAGHVDEAGLLQAALPHVEGFLKRKGIRQVFHHGAYELVGVRLDLVHAVDRVVPVRFLFPGEPGGPAFEHGRRFRAFLGGIAAAPLKAPPPERQEFLQRLRRLHDHEAHWDTPLASPCLEIRHTQGTEAELRAAALRALAIHRLDGTPLDEIAIVARSLEPYLPFLESTLAEIGIPFTTSASLPLRRQPMAAAFLQLLDVLAGDFERASTIELLRSPFLRFDGEEADIDLWDRGSRSGRIGRGIETWRQFPDVLARLESREDADGEAALRRLEAMRCSARALVAFLEELDGERAAWSLAAGVEGHEDFLGGLLRRRLRLPDDPQAAGEARETAAELLRLFRSAALCRASGRASDREQAGPLDPAAALRLLERMAETAALPVPGAGEGGVRILDLMQARGLSHRAVIWIGFQHGAFPRRGRPGLFLDDAARREVAARLGKPMFSRLDAFLEERGLLALTLGSAGERVVVSYQRADETGSRIARSGYLREVARVFAGAADSDRLLRNEAGNPFRPEHVSAHAAGEARGMATSPYFGILPPIAALTAAAVQPRRGIAGAREFLGAGLFAGPPGGAAALDALEVLERFDPSDLSFDGGTGKPLEEDAVLSPSNVERLGRCPLAFFLQHVLKVRGLDREALPHRLEAVVLGSAAHAALRALYRELAATGAFPLEPAKKESIRQRSLPRLEELWRKELLAAAGPSRGRLEAYYRLLGEEWLRALRTFVAADLDRLCDQEARDLELEKEIAATLELPGGLRLSLHGRLDRAYAAGAGFSIDDYKSSGDLQKKLNLLEILRGTSLQLPIYREMAAAGRGLAAGSIACRLLAVGPGMPGGNAELELDGDHRRGFLETLAALVSMAREGLFPVRPDTHRCGYCDYRNACRKDHAPTRHRMEVSPRLAAFRAIDLRSQKQPLLAGEVAAAGPGAVTGAGADGEKRPTRRRRTS